MKDSRVLDIAWWWRLEGRGMLWIGGLFGAVVALVLSFAWLESGAVVFEDARIVRFGITSGRTGNWPRVVVRRDNGMTLDLAASPATLARCRRGGRIHLVRYWSGYGVAGNACDQP